MYTPSITRKEFLNGVLKVEVSFVAGTDKVVETFPITSQIELNQKVREFLKQLNEKQTIAQNITVGAYTPTEEQELLPTQAELDKQEWFRDFNRLEKVTKLKDLGGMPASWTTDLAALASKVQSNAKKAYIADM